MKDIFLLNSKTQEFHANDFPETHLSSSELPKISYLICLK